MSIPTYSHCMTLGLCWFHQQVDTCQSIMMELLDLGCSFLLDSYYHLGLSIWGISSSFEAQGEVNLPRAASHYYQAFFPALFWVKCIFFSISTIYLKVYLFYRKSSQNTLPNTKDIFNFNLLWSDFMTLQLLLLIFLIIPVFNQSLIPLRSS